MSSIIAFLQAVGRRLDDDIMGDLAHLETIPEADRYYAISNEFSTTGIKHSIPIPEGRKFIVISVAVVPVRTAGSNAYCYVDLNFGSTRFDRIFYDFRQDSSIKQRDATYSHFLSGDGVRQINVNVTATSGLVSQVIILGYFTNSAVTESGPVQNLRAEETSPDDIRLTWDEPLNTGGRPIVAYRIRRGDTVDANGLVTNFANLHDLLVSPGMSGSNITYTDSGLADNTTFYYQVIPITDIDGTNTLGDISQIVSATTEVDHPDPVTGVTVSGISATAAQISWTAPADTGGVPLRGYRIQRVESTVDLNLDSIPANQVDLVLGLAGLSFSDLVRNTNSLSTTHRDGSLVAGRFYYYRVKAINTTSRESLTWSNVATTSVSFSEPTNLRSTVTATSVALSWTAPADTGGRTPTGYRIERGTDGTNFSEIEDDTASSRTSYTDESINGNTIYYYRVSVRVGTTVGPASASHRVSTPARPASAPRLSAGAVTDSSIALSWTAPSTTGGLPITGYKLQRSPSVGFPDGSGDDETFTRTNNPNQTINGSASYSNRITVGASQSFVIAQVEVDVNISHTHRGDVEIQLMAPNGQTFVLKQIDFSDTVDNIITTYRGTIFEPLIGENSRGTWTITVHDRWAALDDGTFNSWTLRIVRATTPLHEIELGLDRTYTDEGLDSKTQYFYRIRAFNESQDGLLSNVVNATTHENLFGSGRDGDLVIGASQTTLVAANKEYANISIADGGILQLQDCIIKCSDTFSAVGTGHARVMNTGCAGGRAGVTRGGVGEKDPMPAGFTRRSRSSRGPNPQDVITWANSIPSVIPAVPAVLTAPTDAESCTSPTVIQNLLSSVRDAVSFQNTFTNLIRGTMGSDGTAAQPSGNPGRAGTRGTFLWSTDNRRYYIGAGGDGGDGGTAAQGAHGVRGGGKCALIIRKVGAPLILDASGNDGNNGNQGTGESGETGTPGLRSVRPLNDISMGTAGTNGTAASSLGTRGSGGGQGGIVYIVYDELLPGSTVTVPLASDTFESGLDGWALTSSSGDVTFDQAVENGRGLARFRSENTSPGSYIEKTFDVPAHSTTERLFLHFEYAQTRGFFGPQITLQIFNADNNVGLLSRRLGYTGSSAWNPQSFDLTSSNLGSRIRIRFAFNRFSGFGSTQFRLDNVRFEVGGATPETSFQTDGGSVLPSNIDVSGGTGGFDGANAGAANPLLTTKADDGDDGYALIARTTDI